MRIGVALTGTARVSRARSSPFFPSSLSTGSYPGCHHWRSTAVAWPPCRSVVPVESVVGNWSVPVTTVPWACQL